MKNNLLKLLGVFILLFILTKVDVRLIWAQIKNCNLYFLFLAMLIEIFAIMPKVIKWKLILKILKINVGFMNSLRAYWSGLYLAAITPGKVGDISRVYFLGKNNPSLSRSIFSVILDRLTDIIILLLLGLLASFFYLRQLSQLSSALIISLAGLGLFIWIIFLKRDIFYALFKKLIYKFISKDKFPLKEYLDLSILKQIKARDYLLVSVCLLTGWAVYFSGWWFLTRALHIDISFLQMMAAVSVATVISLMPITISGLGTRDAVMILFFSKLGIAGESALSFSLLIFIIETAVISMGIFFFFQSLKYRGLREIWTVEK